MNNMEIIKRGNLFSKKVYQGKCPNCGCVFSYNSDDIQWEEERISFYEWEKLYKFVNCPECNCQIKISN